MSRVRTATGLLAAVLAVGSVPPGLAQQAGAEGEAPMPEAPHQFKLGVWGAVQVWSSDAASLAELDDQFAYGLEIERVVLSFLSLRVGGAYGTGEAVNDSASQGLNSWLFDLDLRGRLSFGPFGDGGLTPAVLVSVGAVVHDPDGPDLRTRSQTSLGLGLALAYDLTGRVGVGTEWRHLWINQEDVFDSTSRESEQIEADRFGVGLYWRF